MARKQKGSVKSSGPWAPSGAFFACRMDSKAIRFRTSGGFEHYLHGPNGHVIPRDAQEQADLDTLWTDMERNPKVYITRRDENIALDEGRWLWTRPKPVTVVEDDEPRPSSERILEA